MIEEYGNCPLCGFSFKNEEDNARCPSCHVLVYKCFPLVRLSRAWFWEFSDQGRQELLIAWGKRHDKNKYHVTGIVETTHELVVNDVIEAEDEDMASQLAMSNAIEENNVDQDSISYDWVKGGPQVALIKGDT